MSRPLYRSRSDRRIGGVAGGMAAWLGIDPTVVRVVWVVLAIASGGIFVLIYFAMLFVVPEEPWEVTNTSGSPVGRRDGPDGAIVLGAALIVLGAVFLLENLIPAFDLDLLWPIALVAVGVLLVVGAARGRPS